MPIFDPRTGTFRESGSPEPRPRTCTLWTLYAVYVDGHEVTQMPKFRTKAEAEEFKSKWVPEHLTGYYTRNRFVSSFLALCDIYPVEVKTLFREEREAQV